MIISIASGKGGTGKTMLSTNLASYMSDFAKVLLVDLDVEEPNSGLFIKAEKIISQDKYKMIPTWKKDNCLHCGRCQEVCNFNAIMSFTDSVLVLPELCHSCYACAELCMQNSLVMKPKKIGVLSYFKNAKLEFVESKLNIGEEQAVPLIKQTFDYIKENLSSDLQIIDSPPGTACPVVEVLKNTDLLILITEPTPFGLHDLKLAVETARLLKRQFAVVINKYGIGDAKVETYCQAENIPIIAKIPNDRKIAELYSAGELLYHKIASVKKELQKVMDYIIFKKKELML